MLQNMVRGLCRKSCGVVLVAGAIGVLAGVERFLSAGELVPARTYDSRRSPVEPRTADRFSIRRTRSELGYTYWVLQGHGKYRGFALFDSWQEAMDEVQRRFAISPRLQKRAIPAFAV